MQRLIVLLLLVLAYGIPASAQDKYPSKPIKVVVPFGPGSATDIVMRIVGEHMRPILGQPVVIENKPGAFGILAIEEMARSRPDGYTLQIGNPGTNVLAPIIYKKKFKIDYDKDVTLVTRLSEVPLVLGATTKDFPPKTYAEFIAYAKANPGKVRYASVGIGSNNHYDMEAFAQWAGIVLTHLPNKGGGAAITNDLVTGDAHVALRGGASLEQGRGGVLEEGHRRGEGRAPGLSCNGRARKGERAANEDGAGSRRAGLRHRRRKRRRRSDARWCAPQSRCVPAGRCRHLSRHLEFGSLSEGQAVGSARQPGGKGEPADELGDGQPAVVGSEGLCRGAGRRARQRKIPRRVRTVVARGVDRSLRRDRVGGGAALVLGQGRALRHIVLRHQPVVRRQSPAAVTGGDHSMGRFRRSLPRRPVPRRTAQPVHAELVHGALDASRLRSSVPAPSEPLADQHAAFLAAQQSRRRRLPRRAGAMGQNHGADVQRRQLVGYGIASARQHRGLHAGGDAAQEASHPRRDVCASVLLRGRTARSAALLRLLAQRHRQRRDEGAAGEARDP